MPETTHWTQKPENRAKLSEIRRLAAKARTRNAKRQKAAGVPAHKHDAAARQKISHGMKASYARRAAAANGHAAAGELLPLTGKRLARAAVTTLAIAGARLRLEQIEQEREILLIFLKVESGA